MIRLLLLRALAVFGYLPNFVMSWVIARQGTDWRAEVRETFWDLWHGLPRLHQ